MNFVSQQIKKTLDLYKGLWDKKIFKSSSEARYELLKRLALYLDFDFESVKRAFLESDMYKIRNKEHCVDKETQKAICCEIDEVYNEYILNNQEGLSRLFAYKNNCKLVYDGIKEEWYVFEGHKWRKDYGKKYLTEVCGLQLCLKNILKYLRINYKKEANKNTRRKLEIKMKKIETSIKQVQNINTQKQIAEGARCDGHELYIEDGKWDTIPYKLPVNNGVIDLKTGKLMDGNPHERLLRGVDIDFNPQAKCPLWHRTLKEIFNNNRELINYIQTLVGYAVCRNPVEQIFIFLEGRGRNGKDIFLQTICNILGKLSAKVNRGIILTKQYTDPNHANPELLKLPGIALAHFSELTENAKLDPAVFKSLTGASIQSARGVYQKYPVEFVPTATFFLMTNFLPKVDATDFALWQRIKVIPFEIVFVDNPKPDKPNEKKKNPNLMNELQEEYQGILNWIVRGAINWANNGLPPTPQAVVEASNQYKSDVDYFQLFISSCLRKDNNTKVTFNDVYKRYKLWAEDINLIAMSAIAFSKEMSKRGYESSRYNGGKEYRGLELL